MLQSFQRQKIHISEEHSVFRFLGAIYNIIVISQLEKVSQKPAPPYYRYHHHHILMPPSLLTTDPPRQTYP